MEGLNKEIEIQHRLRTIKRHGVRIFREKEIHLITPIIAEFNIDLSIAQKAKYKCLTLYVTENGLTPESLHRIKDLITIGPISIPEKMNELIHHFPVDEQVEQIISKTNSLI